MACEHIPILNAAIALKDLPTTDLKPLLFTRLEKILEFCHFISRHFSDNIDYILSRIGHHTSRVFIYILPDIDLGGIGLRWNRTRVSDPPKHPSLKVGQHAKVGHECRVEAQARKK